jgi:hypothetical protein
MPLILENLSVPVIIIDVQPCYDKWRGNVASNLMGFLNKRTGQVVAFYNNEDIGCDSNIDVQAYYIEKGLEEDVLNQIDFKEKYYAFFRNWMDRGMERGHIIKAIRYMVTNRKNDSRDVTEEEWKKVFGDDWSEFTDIPEIVTEDSINLPDISIAELKRYNGCYLCGGGRKECLAEFGLLMDAFNIKYKLVDKFIY